VNEAYDLNSFEGLSYNQENCAYQQLLAKIPDPYLNEVVQVQRRIVLGPETTLPVAQLPTPPYFGQKPSRQVF
jgi:hypothetical protein